MNEILNKEDREIVTGDHTGKMDFYEYKKFQSKKKNVLLILVVAISILLCINTKCHAQNWVFSAPNCNQNMYDLYYECALANVEAVRRKVKRTFGDESNNYKLFYRQYVFFKTEVAKPKTKVAAAVKLRNDCIIIFYENENDFFFEIDTYLLKAIEDLGICEKYE